jgi:hypothetical protein
MSYDYRRTIELLEYREKKLGILTGAHHRVRCRCGAESGEIDGQSAKRDQTGREITAPTAPSMEGQNGWWHHTDRLGEQSAAGHRTQSQNSILDHCWRNAENTVRRLRIRST